ncbi:hypothetical protein B0G57_108166 [Trinickia symbiotica]|uniref:Serine/threonine protein kinase n=1 Tax=Trinickia symbiotica TaxID=863227 RepID=A0A2N7X2U2_9BURK|nr:hypothetical protein [Trinickia symbiotica]PMS35934.1 serine/threonine protein kinase [Trinickia symbiotica]PPK44586.1 hypothetical protein B0G57_108166 [Trinickia symbiotica]
MSDHITWVVDLDASLQEAPIFAQRGLEWLIQQSIVQPFPDVERLLGDLDLYRPGPKAAAWSELVASDLLHCGLEISVDRTVFHTGDSGAEGIRCPHCGVAHSLESVPWDEAVDRWCASQSDDTLTCPACVRAASIVDWTFFELDWGFGNLGFGFNNWVIEPRLAEELGKVLGHRIKVVHQHI